MVFKNWNFINIYKKLTIMELLLKIFPYANAEIVSAAVTIFGMTLFGLSLGFVLLKFQGE